MKSNYLAFAALLVFALPVGHNSTDRTPIRVHPLQAAIRPRPLRAIIKLRRRTGQRRIMALQRLLHPTVITRQAWPSQCSPCGWDKVGGA